MTGRIFAHRLLENIQTSLVLRSQVPYLDMLKELAEGGMPITSGMLNTSSNFGSFDTALAEVLRILHLQHENFLQLPDRRPLPLTQIRENLSANIEELIAVLDQHIDQKDQSPTSKNNISAVLLDRLDTIDKAAE